MEIEDQLIPNIENLLDRLSIEGKNRKKVRKSLIIEDGYLTHISILKCNLEEIPEDIFKDFPNLEYIDLRFNLLSKLPKELLNYTPNLKMLNLSFNILEVLEGSFFAGHQNLTHLDLSFNRLKSLELQFFENLPKLEYLDISKNKLKHIHRDLFLPLTELKILKIGNTYYHEEGGYDSPFDISMMFTVTNHAAKLTPDINELNILDTQIFTPLVNLEYLDLTQIMIKRIPLEFPQLPKLSSLLIGVNPLENLNEEVFVNLKDITSLYISTCNLEELPDGIFSENKKLKFLNLKYNNLTTLPDSFWELTSLEQLFLGYNMLKSWNKDIEDPEKIKKFLTTKKIPRTYFSSYMKWILAFVIIRILIIPLIG